MPRNAPQRDPNTITPGPNDVYVPFWTDPLWQDQGPMRDRTNWPVDDPIMDMLRPAMLPTDQAKNPTKYAERFGIFPGRTDGRSCTSPTRSCTRLVPPNQPGPPALSLTAQDLVDRFQHAAQKRKMHPDDLMTDRRALTKTALGSDYYYLNAFNELMLEEFWQGCLFGDMTMDELLAGEHFSMNSFRSNLKGPLHTLFRRQRWLSTPFTRLGEDPGNFYNLDGQCFELNAGTNDKIWDALQPALQLASRLFDQNEEFISALMDVTNWYEIPDTIDTRPNRTDRPKFKFEMRSDKSEAVGFKSGKLPTPAFNPTNNSMNVLRERLTWRFASAHYNHGIGSRVYFDNRSCAGVTRPDAGPHDNRPLAISIASELVWQLLTDKLSSGEKMMTSFILAVTMVHELLHACRAAIEVWVDNPARYGISHPDDVLLCQAIRDDLRPSKVSKAYDPYYKDDPVAEVGHAWESHVVGGGVWPMSGPLKRAHPPFLLWFGGISTRLHNADGQKNEEPNLPVPRIFPELFTSYNQYGKIGQVFRQDFWDGVVKKYGMLALRNPPEKPSKAYFTPEEATNFSRSCSLLNWTDEDRRWLVGFYSGLVHGGHRILAQYIRTLILDAHRFEMMARHFLGVAEVWENQNKKIQVVIVNVFMIACEASTFFKYKDRSSSSEKKRKHAEDDYGFWNKCDKAGNPSADNFSKSLHGTADHFIAMVTMGSDSYERRLTSALMQLAYLLDEERRLQESMVCELYELPAAFWKHYEQGIPGHRIIWTARVDRFVHHLRFMLVQFERIHGLSDAWTKEWKAKITSWTGAFDNISRLVSASSKTVHKNWREALVTVPMLRKSGRRPWERWYFLAKKASLNLTGAELSDMQEFRQRFNRMLHLGQYKIVLPGHDKDKQGLAEKWAGLLDNMAGYERNEAKLMKAMGEARATGFKSSLELDNIHEVNQTDKRARSWVANPRQPTQEWQNQLAVAKRFKATKVRKDAFNVMAALQISQANHPPSGNGTPSGSRPQITRPRMSGHPSPLTGSSNSTSRSQSRPVGQGGVLQPQSSKPQRLHHQARLESLEDLTAAVEASTDNNTFAPAGRTPIPIPRQYEISGDVIDELANAIEADLDMMDVDETSKEAEDKLDECMDKAREAHYRALEELERWQEIALEAADEEKRLAERKRRNPESEPSEDDELKLFEDETPRKRIKICGTNVNPSEMN